jgi:nitrite reductase/ring-hydroxylating ferredoxin subunit
MEREMLRAAGNEFITQTGPGTSMGDLFRRYWTPALLAEELPANDCPPVRVKLFSERLVAFRDSRGRYGLIDEFCPHRGVSLWFGRNEECGLRCPYHGWKFDVTGQCLEVPSEPEESGFVKKIKLRSYPLVERGGVLWTYIWDRRIKPRRCRNGNLRWCRSSSGSCRSDSRNAIGSRSWRAASIRAMSPGCAATISIRIRCSKAPAATNTASPTCNRSMRHGKGIHAACAPGTYRPLANKDNDYLIDRAAQRRGETYSGVAGIAMQDASLTARDGVAPASV